MIPRASTFASGCAREGVCEQRFVVDAQEKEHIAGAQGEVRTWWDRLRVPNNECDPRPVAEREVFQAASVGE